MCATSEYDPCVRAENDGNDNMYLCCLDLLVTMLYVVRVASWFRLLNVLEPCVYMRKMFPHRKSDMFDPENEL